MAELVLRNRARLFLIAGLFFEYVLGPVAAAPTQMPRPPCAAPAVPNYPAIAEAPHVMLWTSRDLYPKWKPPSCTAWPAGAATIVVGLAGHSQGPASAAMMLARIGAISSLPGVRYWSVTEGQWNDMFVRATALDGPVTGKPRGDFSDREMRQGNALYFSAADNRSGKDAVSRLHVVAADDNHLAIETENVTPLRWGFLTYAGPGDFQTWYLLDRNTDGSWRFYSMTRVLYASRLFGSVIPENSYINRAVAMYRHFFSQPTDGAPPAAP